MGICWLEMSFGTLLSYKECIWRNLRLIDFRNTIDIRFNSHEFWIINPNEIEDLVDVGF